MAIKRYSKALILFVVYLLIFALITIISSSGSQNVELSPLVPSNNAGVELGLTFFVIWPLVAIIGGVVAGYILTPLFLFVHKKFMGKKLTYSIQERPPTLKFKKTFQAFFPALMAINFALMLAFNKDMLKIVVYNYDRFENVLLGFLFLLMFTIGIAMALFSPIWFLVDAGLVYTNEKKVEGTDNLIETRSLGGWFLNFIKGYAGIGVIFSFYSFVSLFLGGIIRGPGDIILVALVLVPFPILISIAAIPAIILLDITKEKRIKFVRSQARNFGLIDGEKNTTP